MLHMIFYYGLLALLAIALVVAALTDLKRRQIDNWLNLAVALAAPLFWWASGLDPWPAIAIQLAVALGVFAMAAGLFALGQMGGGDVKLIAALALWFPPLMFSQLLIVMAVLGYALTMGLGAWRVGRVSGGLFNRDMLVLLGLSAIAALLMAGFLGGYSLPLRQPDSPAATFAMLQIPVILLAAVSLLAIRIFRRRQVSIAAPYGLAISGAGLWLIAAQLALALPLIRAAA